MKESYYYSEGRKIPISYLDSVRVIRRRDEERHAFIGWKSFPIGDKFELVMRSEILTERDTLLPIKKVSALLRPILATEKKIGELNVLRTEGLLASERNVDEALEIPESIRAFPAVFEPDNKRILLQTGEVVAKFKDSLDEQSIKTKVSSLGGKIIRSIDFSPNTYLLEANHGTDAVTLSNLLMEQGLVDFSHPNFIEEVELRTVNAAESIRETSDLPPNDLYPFQWHLPEIDAPKAWKITRGSADTTICIMDSGIDSKHVAFSQAGKIRTSYDFQDNDVFADPTTSDHGTACAGVAAAPWSIARVVGIASDCSLMAIRRVSNLSDQLKMAEAFAWAANKGADIINCSFGVAGRWVLPDIVRSALDYAVSNGRNGKGCIIVWAAGNENEPISYDEWASYDKVIAVGASTDRGVRAFYSDFGLELDVCAPSNGGTKGITTTTIGGYRNDFGGTSSAAPLVAGVVGLMLSVNPELTWIEVAAILRKSCDEIDPNYGAYNIEGHSEFYGYGRINAYKAVVNAMLYKLFVNNPSATENYPFALQLVDKYLEKGSHGRQMIEYFEQNKYKILKLIYQEETFRRHICNIIIAMGDAYHSLEQNKEITIQDSVTDSLVYIISSLSK
jgi:subtilisin family serine protease